MSQNATIEANGATTKAPRTPRSTKAKAETAATPPASNTPISDGLVNPFQDQDAPPPADEAAPPPADTTPVVERETLTERPKLPLVEIEALFRRIVREELAALKDEIIAECADLQVPVLEAQSKTDAKLNFLYQTITGKAAKTGSTPEAAKPAPIEIYVHPDGAAARLQECECPHCTKHEGKTVKVRLGGRGQCPKCQQRSAWAAAGKEGAPPAKK